MSLRLKRRSFIKVATAGTMSLILGCDEKGNVSSVGDGLAHEDSLDSELDSGPNEGAELIEEAGHQLVTWVRINPDNTATIAMHKAEMGQGVHTALPLIVAEEMELSVEQIRVEIVPESQPFSLGGLPMTYGSTSVANSYMPFRKVGAAAKSLLLTAAATRWGRDASELEVSKGIITSPDGLELSYAELAPEASLLEPPEEPELKDPESFNLIGQDQERFIDRAILNGSAVYGIDATPEGGLYAAIRHAPTPGGIPSGVESLSSDDPAVKAIIALPHAIAVVAECYWTANITAQSLPVTFETPEQERLISSEGMQSDLSLGLDDEGTLVESIGDIDLGLSEGVKSTSAEYHVPHIAHFTMEPVNATAHISDTHCELWVPTQAPGLLRNKAMELTGLTAEQITLHATLLGGGFGRKADSDFAEAAIRIAMEIEEPVTLIWSREEDIRRDRFRPAFSGRFTASVDAAGELVAWDAANCGDSVLGFGAGDPLSAQGLTSLPYAIPHQRNRHVFLPSPIESGFWRSIGHSQNTFFVESFLDEIALLAERDPVEFRQSLLSDHPRVLNVLTRAAELGNWGTVSVEGAHQGVALCDDYGSMMALVCEASVDPDTLAIKVHTLSAVVDCGVAIQPDGVKAQIEGGLLFGLSAALHEEITFVEGEVEQSNLHNYPILTPQECPDIHVEVVASAEAPGGVGEVAVGAMAPALCNAVFAATGIRCRSLPLKRSLKETS